MSTRSTAASSSSSATRKRRSASSPASSPAKRRTLRGGGRGASAAAADPPTLVTAEGEWAKVMRRPREAGEFIDITLLAGKRKILAHKNVLVALSPYLHGLLTSGLAESKHGGGEELRIGDEGTDGRAVEALVDCMYSGELALSRSTVSGVIRTANLFGVGAAEKAACDFFVDALEPSTACEALAFAAAHATCGEHALGLHARCAGYVVEHFTECIGDSLFLELPCEAVVEVIGSDDLPVPEEVVVSAVRAWFDHDAAGRRTALQALVPLVRWPLLPVEVGLQLATEPLLLRLMEQGRQALSLGAQLLLECSAQFAKSDTAAACPRLKRRKGVPQPMRSLGFTAFSQQHYAASEDGALLATVYDSPGDRPALCREVVMSSGQSCAEITVVRLLTSTMMIGVGRPTLNPNARDADDTADFWGWYSSNGNVYHDGRHGVPTGTTWRGQQTYDAGDVLRLLLDSDAGTLTVKKNGALLGVAVSSGLTGDLCWAVTFLGHTSAAVGNSVRIKALEPAEF
jgi:hypothetical protein